MNVPDRPTVLVVDDEEAYVEAFARWLGGDYDVRTATKGEDAFQQLDEAVDVILLDRRMPGLSGDEVLTEVRARDIECQVAMVTAVEPGFDIVEMGFDDYVIKPVSRDDLTRLVGSLLRRASFDEQFRECFSLASKIAALEANRDPRELEHSEEYADLRRRLRDAEARADRTLDELLADGDIDAAYRSIEN
jgi:DNA-binding response OmpR family regulator